MSCTPTSLLNTIIKQGGVGGKTPDQSSFASLPSFNHLFKIFKYLRINDDDKLLVLASLVSDFFVGLPLVYVYLYGESGKGKSVGSKFIKKLIDP